MINYIDEPLHWKRGDLPLDNPYECALQHFEEDLGTEFTQFSYFSESALERLQDANPRYLNRVFIASNFNDEVVIALQKVTEIANDKEAATDPLKKMMYRRNLETIYRSLGGVQLKAMLEKNLYIGVRREGYELATGLGWIRVGDSNVWGPNAKRAICPNHGGLTVGLDNLPTADTDYDECVIFDGAIASGATLIAILKRLEAHSFHRVQIFSIHGTYQGINAILNYADQLKIYVKIDVGACSGRLNDKYYAVSETNPEIEILSDVGDIIVAPLSHNAI